MSEVQSVTTAPAQPQGEEVPAQQAPDTPVSADGYNAQKTEVLGEAETVEVRDRKFRVVDKLPAIILLDLGLASDPAATQAEQLRALRQFLNAAIHPDDNASFEVYLRQAQPVIEMEELNGIVEKLIAQVAGRPTEQP